MAIPDIKDVTQRLDKLDGVIDGKFMNADLRDPRSAARTVSCTNQSASQTEQCRLFAQRLGELLDMAEKIPGFRSAALLNRGETIPAGQIPSREEYFAYFVIGGTILAMLDRNVSIDFGKPLATLCNENIFKSGVVTTVHTQTLQFGALLCVKANSSDRLCPGAYDTSDIKTFSQFQGLVARLSGRYFFINYFAHSPVPPEVPLPDTETTSGGCAASPGRRP